MAQKTSIGNNLDPLLSVRGLKVRFRTDAGIVRAVNGVSFDVFPGETLAIVGESGSGKSVTSLALMGLLPQRIAKIEAGSAMFGDRDLLQLPENEMQDIRGNDIAMIFQEPMTSLDPVMTVGRQIAEAIGVHQGLNRKAAMAAAIEALDLVRVPEPAKRARQFPFQLSGGLRQRVMIAMAMSCNPKILIADEPTTALDVTIQAQILNLMEELQDRIGAAIILITHDLGVVADMANRVAVMYAGSVVEQAPVADLFDHPHHPYTQGLLGSVPRLYSSLESDSAPRLREISGTVPSMREDIQGCPFAPRCGEASDICRKDIPQLKDAGRGHVVACWNANIAETAHA